MHKTWGLDLQHHTTQTECGDNLICNPGPLHVEAEGSGVKGSGVKVLSVFISSVRNHTTEVVLTTEMVLGERALSIGSITKLKGNLMQVTQD